jgi:hypothetical protein
LLWGVLTVQARRVLTVTLTNPAVVSAAWFLDGPAEAKNFTVLQVKGLLEGRGLAYPLTTVVEVAFHPPQAQAYARTLVFKTKKGRSCAIILQGEGSIDENDETSWERPRAWDQKYG